MKIDINGVLKFFDDNMERGHATSVVGLIGEDLNAWAFKHFMEKRGAQVEILIDHVVSGKKNGKWLDRWIYVKEGEKEILYQCEIKNWSCTAIGGKSLAIDADSDKIQKVIRHNWDNQLRTFQDDKFPNGVTKVLTEMKPPKEYLGIKIEPLVIYWMPISNINSQEPFFEVPITEFNNPNLKTKFEKINLFSVSLYFRELKKEIDNSIINVSLPNVEKRIEILKSILPIN